MLTFALDHLVKKLEILIRRFNFESQFSSFSYSSDVIRTNHFRILEHLASEVRIAFRATEGDRFSIAAIVLYAFC